MASGDGILLAAGSSGGLPVDGFAVEQLSRHWTAFTRRSQLVFKTRVVFPYVDRILLRHANDYRTVVTRIGVAMR